MKRLVGFFVAVVAALAGDFWNDKKPADWTAKEAQKLLAKSPWVRESVMRLTGQGTERPIGEESGARARGAGDRASGNRGMENPGIAGVDVGPAGTPGGMQMPSLTVRWESAAPIREAHSKLEIEMPDRAAESYIVSVSGLPFRNQQQAGDPDRKERLKRTATLKIKGKEPILASDVEVIEGERGVMLIFFFSREARIQAADKEIVFEMNTGPMEIQSRFLLKDMKFGGELSL